MVRARSRTTRPKGRGKSQPIVVSKDTTQSVGAPPPTQNKYPGLLKTAGGALGGLVMGPTGALIGATAGDLLSKITGWGDYTVNSNSIVQSNSVPSFTIGGDGVEICHREYISDITGSVLFSSASLYINPGLASTFPWLAQVAVNFEEYELLGLIFEYRPTSGSVATTSAALGAVVYATNYDVVDPAFQSKQAMESYQFSNSTVPFSSMIHPIECAPNQRVFNRRYIRTGNAPSNTDLRLYDLGLFTYATQGMQSAYVVGELWVSYHIRFTKPRISPLWNGPWYIYSATSCTAAAPFNTATLTANQSNNWDIAAGLLTDVTTSTTFVFQYPNTYTLSCSWAGTAIAANAAWSGGSNLTLTTNENCFNTAGTFATSFLVITVSTAGSSAANTLTISGLTSMTGATLHLRSSVGAAGIV